jgi:antitoxin component of MazEF toxin-antitoxin module
MQTVKIRRTGNSNAISLPKDFEELGYVAGVEVVVAAMPSGDLRVLREDHVRELVRELGVRALEKDMDALRILAEGDQVHDVENDPELDSEHDLGDSG